MRIHTGIIGVVLSAALLCLGLPALAAETDMSRDEHLALIKQYEDKAAAAKQEAAKHREMKEEYKAKAPATSKTPKPGWLTKMEAHCDGIIKVEEQAAQEYAKFADYHRMRARELEGK